LGGGCLLGMIGRMIHPWIMPERSWSELEVIP
jgi:hypothetical protein